jgi:hypothetical protein
MIRNAPIPKKRGRKEKVTPNEVFEMIKDNKRITKKKLASEFDVCTQTISNKTRQLRRDGESVIFDKKGYFVLEEILKDSDYKEIVSYVQWVIGCLSGAADCGKPVKTILIESKDFLSNKLSSSQRRSLSQFCGFVKGIVDQIEMRKEIEG